MIKNAIEKIIEMNRPETLVQNGRTYIRADYRPLLDPAHPPLEVETLSGFCDYLLTIDETDPENNNNVFIHVESHIEVSAYLPVQGPFRQRNTLIKAVAPANIRKIAEFFGRWHDPETFIIRLKSIFVENDHLDWMIKTTSSLKKDFSSTLTDNGVTQTITVKKGASLASTEEMKNSVSLMPYRSFVEIKQAPSDFIFRLREKENSIECALFEADGGFWAIDAALTIKTFISERLSAGNKSYPIII